ncbi:Endoribonuclease YbeY [Desulfovibrionales bacterium]
MINVRRDLSGGSPLPLARPEIARLALNLAVAIGHPKAHIGLTLVDDRRMEILHQTYLDCPGPTNVLAFPEDAHSPKMTSPNNEAVDPLVLRGNIAISLDTVLREAYLYGQPVPAYLARLLAHALLHLANHDHGPVMDALCEFALANVSELTGLSV